MVEIFPARSKTEFATGLTVTVSPPLAGELKPIPKVYTLPCFEILVGVAELNCALPPDMDSAKSDTSRFPVPFDTA